MVTEKFLTILNKIIRRLIKNFMRNIYLIFKLKL